MKNLLNIKIDELIRKINGKEFEFTDICLNIDTSSLGEYFDSNNLAETTAIFNNCKIIIDNVNDIIEILKNHWYHILFYSCDIFIKNINLNNFSDFKIKKNMQNSRIFLFNTEIECNNDNQGYLEDIVKFNRDNDSNVVISIFCIDFLYFPNNFKDFFTSFKDFKVANFNLNFKYTTNRTENIPALDMNSDINNCYIQEANVNRSIPYCNSLFLHNSSGKFFTLSREINVSKCRNLSIACFAGTNITVSEGVSSLTIACNGKFNIYFDSPMAYRDKDIEVINGQIKSTNKKSLLRERSNIYKFQLFINEDFTEDCTISKFFRCKFVNCFFGSNQQLFDCEFNKCYFEDESIVYNT